VASLRIEISQGDQTLEVNNLFIIWLFVLCIFFFCNTIIGPWALHKNNCPKILPIDQSMRYISHKHKPYKKKCFNDLNCYGVVIHSYIVIRGVIGAWPSMKSLCYMYNISYSKCCDLL